MFGRRREYRKVAAGSSLAKQQTLWLGPDHLLLVSTYYVIEQYRRFFYRDIQSLVVLRTVGWHVATAIFGAIALLLGSLIFEVRDYAGRITLALFSGIFLFGVAVNLLMGPTCRCRIQTAAGEEILHPIDRVRKARKLLRLLLPKIQEAQPPIDPAEIQEPAAAPEAPVSPAPAPVIAVPPERPAEPAGTPHLAMFGLTLTFGLWQVATIYYSNVVLSLAELGMYFGLAVATVMALIQQQKHHLARNVVRMTWAVLGVFLASMFLGYIKYMTSMFGHPEIASNPWLAFKHFANQAAIDSGFSLFTNAVLGVGAAAVGGFGLAAILQAPRPAKAEPPPLPPGPFKPSSW